MWRDFVNAYERHFCGQQALWQAMETNRIERYFTHPNFDRSAERSAAELEKSGLSDVEVETFPADGRTRWSGWPSMMSWDVKSARLELIQPRRELLCDWTAVPQSLVMYSGPADVEAEVVLWDGQEGTELSGKIPLARRRINDVFPLMRKRNIPGILSDFLGTLPGVRDPFDIPDSCRWENSAIRRGHGRFWGFMLTPRQGAMIREMLSSGPVRVRAQIDAGCYEGSFKSATGLIKGSSRPEEEILFVTHLYEPGANDNASGVGCGLEIARSMQAAIVSEAIPRPARSIRFLFNWEGNGQQAWLLKHRSRIDDMLGGINIDEIGVDQHQGNSVLHLFMPPAANPSCVGPLLEHLCRQMLCPEMRFRAVADRVEIINDTVASDPNIDVPLPCLIQYPSRHYHASSDRAETLSARVMSRIGLAAATHLYTLAASDAGTAQWIARLTAGHYERQLFETDLKLLEGRWPFSIERTARYFDEQVSIAIESVSRFGLKSDDAQEARQSLDASIRRYQEKWTHLTPDRSKEKRSGGADEQKAAATVLKRKTLGTPMFWNGFDLTPQEEMRFRQVIYDNNLDVLFHRICYWSNGRRNVLEIIDRLEIELEALSGEMSISRTSSDRAFGAAASFEINRGAVLYVVEKLIEAGYLARVPAAVSS